MTKAAGVTSVLRYDIGETSGPVRQDNGYLRCDAKLTRVGVFSYRTSNGIRKELRLPEEVFAADAVSSFRLVPLTNEHPAEKGQAVRLDASNTRKFQVGTVTDPTQAGEFLSASVLITDAGTIDQAEKGKRELSCGYHCDLEFSPGVTSGIEGVPDGLRFDAIQRKIRGNHVALVTHGRAGREASLRLDGSEGIQVNDDDDRSTGGPDGLPSTNTKGKQQMTKITLDGVDFEVSEQAAQAIAKVQAKADEAAEKSEKAKTEIEILKARADKADEDLEAFKKDHADATSPEKIREKVAARLDLERSAVKVLGQKKADELKVDTLADDEIRKAVILHVSPAAKDKLDNAEPVYIAARFDQAIESAKPDDKPNPELNSMKGDALPGDRTDSLAAREAMLKHNFERGRAPLATPKMSSVN